MPTWVAREKSQTPHVMTGRRGQLIHLPTSVDCWSSWGQALVDCFSVPRRRQTHDGAVE